MALRRLAICAGLAACSLAWPSDWPAIGGEPGGGQFSALTQITPNNVTHLHKAWEYRAGAVPAGPAQSLEVTPIHADGKIFACMAQGKTVALDGATGKVIWLHDPASHSGAGNHGGGTCRGVSYWQSGSPGAGPCSRQILQGTGGPKGARIYALDADTGALCPGFGAAAGHAGYVELSERRWGGAGDRVFLSSPGVVYENLYITSEGIFDNSHANQPDGAVLAFDVRSGALAWSFSTIPPELSDTTGGANAWPPLSIDLKRGLVFVPTGSPSPDLYGGGRKADIPHADAVVALHARTGELAWSFQTIHHDIFDFDLPAQPIVATVRVGGMPRDAVIVTAKTGFTFVLDRDTGAPLFPVQEREVPASDVPGETAARTQPVPTMTSPFARQTLSEADMFGLTWFDRAWCRARFRESRYQGMFTPPALQPTLRFPSLLGGGNWGGAAYDPANGLLIVKASNLATRIQLFDKKKSPTTNKRERTWMDAEMAGSPYRMEGEVFVSPLGIPCTPPPWGTLTAINLATGGIQWQVPLGQAKRWGITAPKFLDWGSPNVGGPMVTASGLIFIGASMDGRFRALDLHSGSELWSASLPAPGMAVPMSYMANGKQYVVIAAGGSALAGTELGNSLVAFALDE